MLTGAPVPVATKVEDRCFKAFNYNVQVSLSPLDTDVLMVSIFETLDCYLTQMLSVKCRDEPHSF